MSLHPPERRRRLVYGFIEQPLTDGIFPTNTLFTIGGIAYTQKSLLSC